MKHILTNDGVQIEREDRVLSFTLTRPETGNEIDGAMFDAMLAALHCPDAEAASVLRLRAEGSVFCLGRERKGRDEPSIRAEVGRLLALKRAIRCSPLVSVAEVQGNAAGFGFGIAVLCDFTLVAASATLSFPEMRKGLPPAAIMAYLGDYGLPKQILPLLLLAQDFTPVQALAAGLASAVHEPGELAARADALVAMLLAQDPISLRQCKSFFRSAQESTVDANFQRACDFLTHEALRLQARQG